MMMTFAFSSQSKYRYDQKTTRNKGPRIYKQKLDRAFDYEVAGDSIKINKQNCCCFRRAAQ